jgi:hypothetical protein
MAKVTASLEQQRVMSVLVVTGTRGRRYDMVALSWTTLRGLYRATVLGVAAVSSAALLGMMMASSITPLSDQDRQGILITVLRAIIDCCRNYLHLP